MNPKTPHALKVLAGTVQPSRIDGPEVPQFDLVTEFPEPPQHLNPDGREMWQKVGPQLVQAGVLQTVDLSALEQLSYAWQLFRQKAKAQMEISASENNALTGLFAQFGLTPAARRRVLAAVEGGTKPPANRFSRNGQRPA